MMKMRNRIYWISLIILCVLISSVTFSCKSSIAGVILPSTTSFSTDGEKAGQSQEQTPSAPTNLISMVDLEDKWREVLQVTGENGEKTLTFTITGDEWCISWYTGEDNPETALFTIIVYREDISTAPVKVVTNSGKMNSDIIEMHEGNNEYQVKIIAANVNGWAIRIGEKRSNRTISPVSIVRIQYQGTKQKTYDGDINACFKKNEPDEYVAIKNESDSWQDIRGWTLVNETKGLPTFTFPDYYSAVPAYYTEFYNGMSSQVMPLPCLLGPRQMVLVYTDEFNSETGGFHFNYGYGDIWNNEIPDTAVLYNAEGTEVSRKSYIIEEDNPLLLPVYIVRIEYKGTPSSVEYDDGSCCKIVEYNEYVVIKNRSNCFQNMSRWILQNSTKGNPSFVFPEDFYICPSETIRVYTNEIHPEWSGLCLLYYPSKLIELYFDAVHYEEGAKCSFFPPTTVPPQGVCSFQYTPGDIWNDNSQNIATLYNADGEEISSATYDIHR
jgi:hypothetical protein